MSDDVVRELRRIADALERMAPVPNAKPVRFEEREPVTEVSPRVFEKVMGEMQ